MTRKKYLRHIVRDIFVILASILLALFLVEEGIIKSFLELTGGSLYLSSFIAGIFFTFIFTIAPAGVALVLLGQTYPVWEVALFGALGAMCMDMLIIYFVKKDLARDINELAQNTFKHHLVKAFHFGFLKWVAFMVGLVLVATPLPDELGLVLIGLSKIKSKFIPVIFFAAHFIGIFTLLSIAGAV